MAMLNVDDSSLLTAQIGWLVIGELLQWLCHDDTSINIVLSVIIVIIIIPEYIGITNIM